MEAELFKERYDALRRVYEQRLEHLTSSVRKIYQSVKTDEVGQSLQNDPASRSFLQAHLSELVESELGAEREEFVQRLVSHVSILEASCNKYQSQMAEHQRRAEQLEGEAATRMEVDKHRDQTLAELQQHALDLQTQSQNAIQESQQKVRALSEANERLVEDRAGTSARLESVSESARRDRDEARMLKAQLEARVSNSDDLMQKLRASEFQVERHKVLLSEEQQRSAQLSAEIQVQQERLRQADAKHEDCELQMGHHRSQMRELEAAYNHANHELHSMKEKFQSLHQHVETVISSDAKSNEETVQSMQRRVDEVKEKLEHKLREQAAESQAAAVELTQARAQVTASDERVRKWQLDAQHEEDLRKATEERLTLQEQETRRYQAQVQDLQAQLQGHANQLFQQRAEADTKLIDTSHRLEAAKADRDLERNQSATLQSQLRGAADRLVALEQRLATEREANAVLEADVERERIQVREAEAAAREQEQAKLALAQHLNEATGNIARLKAIVKQERQVRHATEQTVEQQRKVRGDTEAALAAARESATRSEFERSAHEEEARKLGIEANELRKRSDELREDVRAARRAATDFEQKAKELSNQREQGAQQERLREAELDKLGTELKSVLAQLEEERKLSRERQEREGALTQQVDTFSTQFKQLEVALQRTHEEKTSYQATQQKVLETHATERRALEQSIASLERKVQAAHREIEAQGSRLRAKEAECSEAVALNQRRAHASRSLAAARNLLADRIPPLRRECGSIKVQIKADIEAMAIDMERMVRVVQATCTDRQGAEIARLNASFEREKVSLQRTAMKSEAVTHDQILNLSDAKAQSERQREVDREKCSALEEQLASTRSELVNAQDKIAALQRWQATLIDALAVDIPSLEGLNATLGLAHSDGSGSEDYDYPPDSSINEIRRRILLHLDQLQEGTTAPLATEIASLRKASAANDNLVIELRKEYSEMQSLCQIEGEKASKLETKLTDLENETQELRARSKLTEDLERSQSELAMIAELQRMENLNEKRALKDELRECNRKHDLLMKQTTQQHTEKIADVKRHFEGELTKILDQHNELVAELEHRIKNERGRYRDLQDRSHQHIQQLEAQVSALQESCDLNALDGGLRRASGNSSGFVEAAGAGPLQTPNTGLSIFER